MHIYMKFYCYLKKTTIYFSALQEAQEIFGVDHDFAEFEQFDEDEEFDEEDEVMEISSWMFYIRIY